MELVNQIISIALFVISVFLFYKTIYTIIGLFSKKRVYKETGQYAKYAILLPARNEEAVIGKLIESINNQEKFPVENLKIFVVADNCTDKTADVCRSLGAVVYERFDETKKRKGYALEYLVDHIYNDFGKDEFDAYVIFDSDNLLESDYFYQMNKAFQENHHLLVSYRNTKNFGQNWISAAYGFHNARTNVFLNRPRAKLNVGTNFGGTGILLGKEYLKDGWHYVEITEDCQCTLDLISKGEKIYYVEDAILYDEQPHDFKTVYNQRLRWEKGILICIFKYFNRIWKRIFKGSFTAYDAMFSWFPFSIITLTLSLIYPVYTLVMVFVDPSVGFDGIYYLKLLGSYVLGNYVISTIMALLIIIKEKDRIYCPLGKRIFYAFTWFWFDLCSVYFLIISLFTKVKWKTIKHDCSIELDDVKNSANK